MTRTRIVLRPKWTAREQLGMKMSTVRPFTALPVSITV
jgi:hypothetical protein